MQKAPHEAGPTVRRNARAGRKAGRENEKAPRMAGPSVRRGACAGALGERGGPASHGLPPQYVGRWRA